MAKDFQGFRDFFQHTGIDHVVHEESAHEEFHREIVNPAHIAFRVDGQCLHHAFDDHFLNRFGSGDPPFAAGGRYGIAGEAEFQLVDDFLLKAD